MNFQNLKIKFFLPFLQKRLKLFSFCVLVLIILGVSLIVFRFLDANILNPSSLGGDRLTTQDIGVNMRLYREVMEKMTTDERGVTVGIRDLRNPFYSLPEETK